MSKSGGVQYNCTLKKFGGSEALFTNLQKKKVWAHAPLSPTLVLPPWNVTVPMKILLLQSMSWWKSCLQLLVITAFYFISSIALTFYQKDLIQRLPYPLSIVIVHLVLKFCVAGLCRYVWATITKQNRVSLKILI